MSAAAEKAGIGATVGRDSGQLTAYLEDLVKELLKLGELGGVITPAIYDTAQLLRYAPPADPAELERLVDWLLQQQQQDGGWGGEVGSDSLPRHVPTLAAVLALHEKAPESRKAPAAAAVRRGLDFLNQTANVWSRNDAGDLPDDIPVAAELTLPLLLKEAAEVQARQSGTASQAPFEIQQAPFQALRALGDRRKMLINGMLIMASTSPEGRAPMHTWEAWDKKAGMSLWLVDNLMPQPLQLVSWAVKAVSWPVKLGLWPVKFGLWSYLKKRGPRPGVTGMDAMDVMDGSGGVGHSPVATALWLKALRELQKHWSWKALDKRRFQKLEASAEQFLQDASKATLSEIPGVVPTVWPINRFEQSWALFSLYVMGLLDEKGPLLETVRPQLDELRQVLNRNKGLGMSDHFVCDGDITATTISLLVGTGRSDALDGDILNRFMRGKHFLTYDYELQPSVTTTAHATMAFALVGRDTSHLVGLLLGWQDPGDGHWRGDKWHKSWLYTTSQVMIALSWAEKKQSSRTQDVSQRGLEALRKGLQSVLATQRADGGWGFSKEPTLAETAYAVQSLYVLKGLPLFDATVKDALRRAARWMKAQEAREEVSRRQSLVEYRMKKEKYWIGKELYCPYRVDRVFELSALYTLESDPELRSTP